MAADRESNSQPGNDFSDLVFSEYWDMLEQQADEAARQTREADRQARSADRQAQSAGQKPRPRQREAQPVEKRPRPAQRRPARQERNRSGAARPHTDERLAAPAPRPVQQHRRTSQQIRRKRKLIGSLVLIAVIAVVFCAVTMSVDRVTGFQVASSATDQQVLSWEQDKDADAYDIYDGSGTLLAELDAAAGTQYAVGGLQSGTQYTYSIVAVKDFLGRHSSRGTKCSAYTLLEPVQTVSAMNSGTGAMLSWEDSGASGYEVQYTDASGAAHTLETRTGDDRSITVPELQDGCQYTFQFRSFIQDGEDRVYSDWTAVGPITGTRTADMTGIDIAKPMVALTFDDGPDYEDVTTRILDTLKQYGGHVTFFQLGNRAEKLPGLMSRMAEEGHEIACHTYDHTHYGTDVTSDDIIRANDVIEQSCGQRPSAFRSPGGETTDLIRQTCGQEGIPVVYWSLDTADWQSRNADSICDVVMDRISDGDIVLMHNIYDSTADAVERIVPFLVEEGYQLVTVSQLILAKTGHPPVPGEQYVNGTVTN